MPPQNDKGGASGDPSGAGEGDRRAPAEPLAPPTPPPRRVSTLVGGTPANPGAAPAAPAAAQAPITVPAPLGPPRPAPKAAPPRPAPPARVNTLPGGTPNAMGAPPAEEAAPVLKPFTSTLVGGVQGAITPTPPQAKGAPPAAAAAPMPAPVAPTLISAAPAAPAPIAAPPIAAAAPPIAAAAPPIEPAAKAKTEGGAPEAAQGVSSLSGLMRSPLGKPGITRPQISDEPAAAPAIDDPPEPATIQGQLRRRARRLKASDPVGAARAYVELGIYEERVTQDRAAARAAYEAARALVRRMEPALGRIRRLLEGRAELERALEIVDDELAIAESDTAKADLWAERARTCEALGRLTDAHAGYAEALRFAPLHAASLRGLESALRREIDATRERGLDPALAAQLAAHLERVADAYAPVPGERPDGDARLAAWIHVERAAVLDRDLGQPEIARAALERAVAFEPAPGPVRDALSRHLARHDETRHLADSLSVEADHEPDGDRASRLLYAAARLLVDRVGTSPRAGGEAADMANEAAQLLSRGAARAPESSPTAWRILAELIRLLERVGALEQAAEVRQKRLPLIEGAHAAGQAAPNPEALAHEHVCLSEIFDGLGRADQAAHHAERALDLDPDDVSTRDRLDRALQRLGRHEERVRAWVVEANATRPRRARVAALLRAADIADRHLRRRDEALGHLRAAWSIDPGNGSVFDAISALLAPPPRDPDSDARGVRARIDLYAQAAQAADDPARKVGLLEKLVSIWEDELGQPARAAEELERILVIEPGRRTAILALQRNAERAGDARRLARALQAEAELTIDPPLARRLLLRAAELFEGRLADRDRAFALVDRALALDPKDPDALRARHRLHDRAGRHEEARRTLLALIAGEPDDAKRYALWIEVAVLDEQRLKRPHDAVDAYGQAALVRPRHPLPPREITRLLRDAGDPAKLVEALIALAANAADGTEYARLLFQAAEVQEHLLRDDDAALKCLARADSLGPDVPPDPALIEEMERIHVRRRGAAELAALYARWLERHPPPAIDHNVRVALAGVLSEGNVAPPADHPGPPLGPKHAVELLEGLVGVVPNHVPALRMLEQLHRRAGAHASLAGVLRAEADVLASALARSGALWELVSLEEQIGSAAALEALGRIVVDAPRDLAALDAVVRVAGRLVAGVNVPHPAALATRARLVPAIRARRELTREPVARAVFQLEEALLIEAQGPDDPASVRAALAGYHAALTQWPESLLAARGLERLAERMGDRPSLILSQLVLSKLAEEPRDRAAHIVRAAGLTAEDPQPKSQSEALALYEEALGHDADNPTAAHAIARMLAADVPRLVDRLGAALDRAQQDDQVVLLGAEIGRAILRQRVDTRASTTGQPGALPDGIDPGIGVAAMRRVLAILPDDVPSLLVAARLFSMQRVWAEARDTLLHAIEVAAENEPKIAAHFMLADLYEGPLGDSALAQAALQTVLVLDDTNRRALERLHALAAACGDRALAIQVLAQLAEVTSDPAARVDIDLRLAETCREAGDAAGRVHALQDAIVSAPNDLRAWTSLARLYRPETEGGAAAYAAALQQIIDLAAARRSPIDQRWLVTLGMLEITVLVRAREGVAHLQQAALLPGAPPEARIALGRGLEGAGRNTEASQVLRDVLATDAEVFARVGDLSAGLASLEAALAKEGRADERLAVEEVRACLGDVKPDRLARLRARRLADGAPYVGSLLGAELAHLIFPEARSALLDVAAAIAPIAAKILRFELASLGVGSRERLGPRDNHPTRALADRMARALGVEAFELYLSPTWQGAARVYPGDPPAIVAGAAFAELPEPEQAFALARLVTRAALGMTWLDELPVDAADGLLLASLRAAAPTFAQGEISPQRESMAQSFAIAVQKAIGRRQKKQLEEIAPTVPRAFDTRSFSIGVRRSEYRIAYVLAGDLVGAIDYLRRFDREIGRSAEEPRVLLQHPVTNELLRYVLTAEAYAERRRIGTVPVGA